jgi:hypothetical protein
MGDALARRGNRVMDETEAPRPHGAWVGRVLLIATPIVLVIGTVRFILWWGAQSQRAMLRGRRWPPEPLMVLLGR